MSAVAFLVALAARVTVLLACAGLLTFLLRRASAAWRHLVWSGVLIGILVMPVVMALGPRWSVPLLPPAAAPASLHVTDPAPVGPYLAVSRSPVLPPAAAVALNLSEALWTAPSPGTVMIGVWFVGLAMFAGWLLIGMLRLRRLAGEGRRVEDAGWRTDLDEARRRLSLTREVTVLSGVGTPVPLTWGTLRPVILLPDDAGAWVAGRRQVVLLHELAHVRRCDCLTQTIGRLVCAVHWFNPVAWLAVRQLASERERACDELVLACGTRASDYAQHLLSFARPNAAAGWPAAVAMPMARSSQLESRLRTILKPRVPRPPRGTITPAMMTVALAGLVLAVATAQPAARAAAPAQAAASPAVHSLPAARPALAAEPQPAVSPSPAPQPAAATARPHQPVAAAKPQPASPPARPASSSYPARLIAELGSPSRDVREKAAILLGLTDAGPAGVDALIRAARDPDPQVREKAVISLGLQGNRRAYATLIAALKDPDAQVREKAAIGLGLLGDRRAMDALVEASHDDDPQVREQARAAMVMLKAGAQRGAGVARLVSTLLGGSLGRLISQSVRSAVRAAQPFVDACAPAACNGGGHAAAYDRDLARAVRNGVKAGIDTAAIADVAAGMAQAVANGVSEALRQAGTDGGRAPHHTPRPR